MLKRLREGVEAVLSSGNGDQRRPQLGKGRESSVKGLFVIGDLAGAPVIKLAMAQGVEVIDTIASLPDMRDRACVRESIPEAQIPGGGEEAATAMPRPARSGHGQAGAPHPAAGGAALPAASSPRPDKGLRDQGHDDALLDVLVVGAGAAGLNAALAAQDRGLSCVVLEKEKIANTIENFPEGKWIYAEPDRQPPKGKLWLDGARKEELVARWHGIIRENRLDVRTGEPLVGLEKGEDGHFTARTPKGSFRARKVVIASGQRGVPRRLGVAGEEHERVYHRLYSPRAYEGETVLVVGGGNSAVEAALTLAERNRVVLSYRGGEFTRLYRENREKLKESIARGRIEVLFRSRVKKFRPGPSTPPLEAILEVDAPGSAGARSIRADHAFVLIGAELPATFLKSLGIRLENDWTGAPVRAAALTAGALLCLRLLGGGLAGAGPDPAMIWAGALGALACLAGLAATGLRGDRWSWLGLSFLVCYSIYGIKYGAGEEFWPFRGWGYQALSFFGRPWSFWYTVLYTVLMTAFGLEALKRWGIDRKDRFQLWRYTSLISFQWIFFFIVPEFLFQWAVRYQWIGEKLASDPQFADQAWRSYGIVYAWPLFFYTFFYDPHTIWVLWGLVLTFVIIPILVLFHGKRYCSWICGCGGLAETLGDRWRHLAPKGKTSIRWEWMNGAVLIFAVAVTAAMLGRDAWNLLAKPADWGVHGYRVVADVWLVGILPVTLYPFLGGKIWCRYWCPLAKLMQIESWIFTRTGLSRFRIVAGDKCIACSECSRNCQVGIDVMQYALRQAPLDNATSSCIGCGICVTVCPMETLSFGAAPEPALPLYRAAPPAP